MGWEREKEREIGRETERETQRERQIMQYKKVDERGREREGNYRRKKHITRTDEDDIRISSMSIKCKTDKRR